MSDLISRKEAVDIGRRATVDTNPSHFDSHQKFEQFMDDVEISSFGRWQWANGFNTALTAISIDLKQLPSAEPERLTDDDFETIRIHLNAQKEKLCNQQRWKEAEEYQRIIDRFMTFASAEQERKKGKWIYATNAPSGESCYVCSECGVKLDSRYTSYCGNCGADMRKGDA